MRRVLRVIGLALGISYLLLCGGLVYFERALVYPTPARLRAPSWASIVTIPQGTAMLWAPAKPSETPSPVLVFFHGSGEQIADAEWLADGLRDFGLSLAAVEYPGYPGCGGVSTEEGLVAAGEAALRHLTGPMGIDRARIVLVGQLLGSGVAVQLAARSWGTKLVLLSPYTSLPDVAAKLLPFVPVRLLMRSEFDSAAWAGQVRQPVLIIHGTEDRVVPYEFGLALSTLFSPKARLLSIPGGKHSDLWDRLLVHKTVSAFAFE